MTFTQASEPATAALSERTMPVYQLADTPWCHACSFFAGAQEAGYAARLWAASTVKGRGCHAIHHQRIPPARWGARAEPLAAKRRRVDALLERLALQACAGTAIGDALSRGISGGQARGGSRQPAEAQGCAAGQQVGGREAWRAQKGVQ